MIKKITGICQNPYIQQDLGDQKGEIFWFSLSEAEGVPGMSTQRGTASPSSDLSGARMGDNQKIIEIVVFSPWNVNVFLFKNSKVITMLLNLSIVFGSLQ